MAKQKSQGWWGVSVIAVMVVVLLGVAMYYSGVLGDVSIVGGAVTSENELTQCDDTDSEADTEGSSSIWRGGYTRMRTRDRGFYEGFAEWRPWQTRETDSCLGSSLREAYCTTFTNTFALSPSQDVTTFTRSVDCQYGCITDADGLASCRLPPCTDSDANPPQGRGGEFLRGTTTGIIPSEALGFPPTGPVCIGSSGTPVPCSWPPPPPPSDTLQVSRTYTDSCATSTRLIEYSCANYGGRPPRRGGPANQAVVRMEFSCPPLHTCSDGACVSSSDEALVRPVPPSEIQPAARSSKSSAKSPPPPVTPACTPAPETCDGQDNDCDSTIDEGCDDDNDNYCDAAIALSGTPPTCTAGGGDCRDATLDGSASNPGATEVCGNAVDENCDTVVDSCPAAEASPPAPSSPSCTDSDGANARDVSGTATSTDAMAQGPTRTSPEIAGTPVDGGLYAYPDSCSADGRMLYQYSCLGTDVRRYDYACPPRTGMGYGFCITDATGSYCPSCATTPGAAGCPSS